MKELGKPFDTPFVSVGKSGAIEQKDFSKKEEGNYSFDDALAEKQTKEDKSEKKELEHRQIEKEETKEEINKKEYENFMQRQNLLLSNNMNSLLASQQMSGNLQVTNPAGNLVVKNAAKAGNQLVHQGEVGLKELQKLMSQRGISFNQLNNQKMAKLTTIHSRAEVTNFLNELVKELRYDKDDKNVGSVDTHQMFGDKKKEQKGEKVSKIEEKKKIGTKTQGEEDDKMNEASSAAENINKTQAMPFTNFFEGAKLSEFKQGSPMEQQIMKQIVDKMEINTEKAKSEVAIKLNPEYLGEVRLNMTVDKEKGTVAVKFNTTSREAKKTLEGNLASLESAFAAAGLKMEKFEVSLDDELG